MSETCYDSYQRPWSIAGMVVSIILLTGCSSELSKVSGTVVLDGEPLDRGVVTFQADGKPMAIGQIRSNGTYQMKTGSKDGVVPGVYQVTVSAYQSKPSEDDLGEPIPVLLTPAQYNSPGESGLTADVKPGRNNVDLPLVSN